jgi:mannose-1-phosphate guanylyltransferase/phosphomannomutase
LSLGDGALIETPCYIGSGCVIGENARISKGCVIGDKVYVGDNAQVHQAVIWDGAHIGEGVQMSGCVVQNNVIVGARAKVHEGCVIGGNARIGQDASIFPDVRIWPVCQVADGANARANVVGRCKSGFNLENSAFSGVISPEDACLFGASCAASLSSGRICVSHDGTPAGAMLAHAVQAGAASTGSRVFSCGKAELRRLYSAACKKTAMSVCMPFRKAERLPSLF